MIAQISWWWWFLFLLLSAAMAFLMYYRDKLLSELPNSKKWFLAFLRFVFIFIIFSLLFAPLIRTGKQVIEKPIIVFAQDNSASVKINPDSTYYKSSYANDLNALQERLSNDYQVVQYNFGDNVRIDSVIDFSDLSTNMSDIFPVLNAAYSGMNLGAVVIAGDGLYNIGENPAYSNNLNVPVYAIALGDTIKLKDMFVRQVQHNRIAFYKNRFPVRVMIGASGCKNQKAVVSIYKGTDKLFEKEIVINDDDYLDKVEAEIEAYPKGLQQYDVVISPCQGEISTANNKTTFVVDVIDNRQHILLLGNGPHPDLGALFSALKNNPDYNVELAYIGTFNKPLDKYHLVILNQLPSVDQTAGQVLKQIAQKGIPCLFILGGKTSVDAFNQSQSGIKIVSAKTAFDEASPSYVSDFSAFVSDPEWIEISKSLPPLLVPFGNYQLVSNAKLFMTQRINSVNTDRPLIAFVENGGVKNGVIAGEGIWKWRLESYRISGSHELFGNFVNRMVQYLITMRVKQNLVVDSKKVFNENELVFIEAEFYDEAFELNNSSELKISIFDSEKKELKQIFDRTEKYYTLDMGSLPPGRYSYTASLDFDDKTYSANGEFIVININLEAISTGANHSVFFKMTAEHNGATFYPDKLNELESHIRNNDNIAPRVYYQDKLSNLIDLKLLFFVIVLFAATEWFLRKYWGLY